MRVVRLLIDPAVRRSLRAFAVTDKGLALRVNPDALASAGVHQHPVEGVHAVQVLRRVPVSVDRVTCLAQDVMVGFPETGAPAGPRRVRVDIAHLWPALLQPLRHQLRVGVVTDYDLVHIVDSIRP